MNTPKKVASSGKIKTKPPPPKKTFRIPAFKAATLFLRKRRKRELRPISFLESAKYFFFPEIGLLRILKMVFIIGAVIFFSLTEARESDIIFTVLETFIIFAFLIIYMLTLNHLLLILDWPLFEIVNSIVTAVFLLVLFALALLQEENKTLFFLGGILSFAAAVVCFVDAYLITQSTKNKVKKVLGFKDEPEKVSISPVPPDSKQAIPSTSLASSKASSVASSRPSSLATSMASSRATSKASSRASSKSLSRATSVASIKE